MPVMRILKLTIGGVVVGASAALTLAASPKLLISVPTAAFAAYKHFSEHPGLNSPDFEPDAIAYALATAQSVALGAEHALEPVLPFLRSMATGVAIMVEV